MRGRLIYGKYLTPRQSVSLLEYLHQTAILAMGTLERCHGEWPGPTHFHEPGPPRAELKGGPGCKDKVWGQV